METLVQESASFRLPPGNVVTLGLATPCRQPQGTTQVRHLMDESALVVPRLDAGRGFQSFRFSNQPAGLFTRLIHLQLNYRGSTGMQSDKSVKKLIRAGPT